MSLIAVTGRLGHDGTVEHPAHWHRDRDDDPAPFGHQGLFGPDGPFGHRGPSWLRRGSCQSGPPRRDPADRLGGGVAAGVAAWRGFNPAAVRIVFVLATLVSAGWGVPLYVAAWLFMPAKDAETNIFSKARTDTAGIRLAVGLGSLLIFMLLVAGALNGGWFVSWAWPQVFSVAGLVLIWRNASEEEQATLRHLLEPLGAAAGDVTHEGSWRRRGTILRLGLATVLLAGGLGWLFSAHASMALLRPLGGVLLVAVAIVLILGPWWLRIIRDLGVERQAKARAEERVDIASRVHDSVLQTLALIQRRADDPQKVVQLARQGPEFRSRSAHRHGRGTEDPGGHRVPVRRPGRGGDGRRLRPGRQPERPAGRGPRGDGQRGQVVGRQRDLAVRRGRAGRGGDRGAGPGQGLRPRDGSGGPQGPGRVGPRPDGPAGRHRDGEQRAG
jgi:phage shock protein PspC (stress-responsive transcriptional regulator)